MTHASVFSGIGGPEVAATMLGWENLFHCEINPFGRRVLDYWYPNSKSYEDITTTDFTEWRGRVNVLTGGFPCQPFSYAGKRGGAQDDRYLWPYMFRCIDQIRPDWVVAENVAGILTMVEQGEVSEVASAPALFDSFDRVRRYQLRETFTLQRICDDLESHGYAVQPVLVPACGVGAPHRRDRVFIIGHRVTADPGSGGQSASEQQGERAGQAVQQQSREQSQHGAGRPSDAPTIADPVSSREGTPRKSDCAEGCGSDANQQPSEWGAETEWNHRFYAILRNAPHPDSHRGREVDEHMESELADGAKPVSNGRERNAADTCHAGLQEARAEQQSAGHRGFGVRAGEWFTGLEEDISGCGRWSNFPSVSPVHRGNDGLPFDVDRLTISFGKWRTEALKAYGNAIVPQVMYEIFRAIEQVEQYL